MAILFSIENLKISQLNWARTLQLNLKDCFAKNWSRFVGEFLETLSFKVLKIK